MTAHTQKKSYQEALISVQFIYIIATLFFRHKNTGRGSDNPKDQTQQQLLSIRIHQIK